MLFTVLLMHGLANSQEHSNKSCAPSQCGVITNISHPFRLQGDPPECGDRIYELACENNLTFVKLYNGTYRVTAINYSNYTIRLIDVGIQEGNCSSLPHYLLSQSNFTDTYTPSNIYYDSCNPYQAIINYHYIVMFKHVVYLKCRDPVRDDPAYVDTSPCVNWQGGGYVYAVAGDLPAYRLKSECHVEWVATIGKYWESMLGDGVVIITSSYSDVHSMISYGFEVSWWRRVCVDFKCPSGYTCYLDSETYTLGCFQSIFHQCDSPMGITEIYSEEGCSKSVFI